MATPPPSRPPDRVRARLSRSADRQVRGGLLSVADTAALAAAGFEPVSEVIGAVADAVTPGGFYSSGSPYTSAQTRAAWDGIGSPKGITYTSDSGNVGVGVPPTITALKAGFRTMLTRLIAEARAVGADGVIDVRFERTVEPGNGTELWRFLAVGTAVRSKGGTHTDQPFTTDLSGSDMASGLRSGWVPLSLLIEPCMAVRWIDARSQLQRRFGAGNSEVDAYAEVVNICRRRAADNFRRAAAALGAESAVLSDMTLDFEAKQMGGECTATVMVTGTALASFRVPDVPPRSLSIMPLSSTKTPNGEKR